MHVVTPQRPALHLGAEDINRPNLQCMGSADWNICSYEIVKRLVNNAWIENEAGDWRSSRVFLIRNNCSGNCWSTVILKNFKKI